MQRFHFPTLNNQEIITISNNKDLFHQLTKVLRTKIWEEIIFFDWSNLYDYTYKIESIEKKSMSLKLTNKIQKSTKNQIALNLYQSLPNKQEKIELILQKGVEVWYTNFFFFKSERSQNLKLSENKIERFNKIVIEAVEQSGNNIIPELHFLEKIDFRNIKWDNIYFHTDKTNAKKLKELDIKSKKANIFVWPEWGFTDNETINFDKIWFQKANLWDSILRTETTWIVVWFYLLQNI